MDGRQFLQEAREARSAYENEEWDGCTLESFKRTIFQHGHCHYFTGYVGNYFYALLRVRTITEMLEGATESRWQDELAAVSQRVRDETYSTPESLVRTEELLVELVIAHFDEIVAILKEREAQRHAIQDLHDALNKCPSICASNMDVLVDNIFRQYTAVTNAQEDIETYRKMMELANKLHVGGAATASSLKSSIVSGSKAAGELAKTYAEVEGQLCAALTAVMEGKYIYWNDHGECFKRITRCTGLKFDGKRDKSIYVHGPSVLFDWSDIPTCNAGDKDCGWYLSYMSDLNKSIPDLHVVEWDTLVELVEKHAPFLLNMVKKLKKED